MTPQPWQMEQFKDAGTAAAAATAVIVGDRSAPRSASLELVNPFLFPAARHG
ncbi:hypothetical protein WMF04_07850 [Sorangium sp. So ce260]|uniref:hypothetical protein n=1 Tax=Sorangium sp. So ce260 TaxID=3133291 RepID=UPI003F5DEDE5